MSRVESRASKRLINRINVQVQKELAFRFCVAVEPFMSTILTDWAVATAIKDAEARSSNLLTAWGTTRTFEKKLMSLVEGAPEATGAETEYDVVKARARAYGRPAAAAPRGPSVFDVRTCHA
jgi:hypothetical protein